MHIDDKNFHGSDPKTSRPFSSGHPDGVWMIAIVFCLLMAVPIVGLVVSIGMMFFGAGSINIIFTAMGATAVAIFLFFPAILLLFQRSGKVFYVFVFYSVILSLAVFFLYFFEKKLFPIAVGLILLQARANYYVFRLKQDRLIGSDKDLERP
jgi:hypothetical protein